MPSDAQHTAQPLSKVQAVRLAGDLIATRTPAAIVRFGEGEARVLCATAEDEISMDQAVRKLAKQTGMIFSPGHVLRIKALLLDALGSADIVGIGFSKRFSEEHKEWMRRIEVLHSELRQRKNSSQSITHCTINQDLRDQLADLLSDARQLSVVSCRDLESPLVDAYDLDDVAVYQIPSQYVMRDVDSEYEARLHEVPIWPDFYADLDSRIQVRERGEVFLVGAGIFGKSLCIRIRKLGGIALDMGSTLDGMAGKVTRGRNRPTFRRMPDRPQRV